MRTLIEIHALQNFAPSNLNRDDTGAPKDALFGGTRRARVSSQCIKRAIRQSFVAKRHEGFFNETELAVRTKRVYEAIAERLHSRDRSEAIAKAKIALSYVKLKAAEGGKTQYLLFLGNSEIINFARVIDQHWDSIVPASPDGSGDTNPKPKKGKKETAKAAPKEVQEYVESILDGGKAVDVALFGRMLADIPDKNLNAACQVAHAISTHSVDREFDYYTAVDDLKPDDTAGADMIGTVEFNSACFYRYAVVDWDKLVENLQEDEDLAAKGLRAFIDGFVTAEPTGKQNTFAAHNPTEFVAVSVRRNGAPRNLANAFEVPVRVKKGESLTAESVTKLIEKANSIQKAFGGEDNSFVLNLTKAASLDYGQQVDTLKDLLEKTAQAVRG